MGKKLQKINADIKLHSIAVDNYKPTNEITRRSGDIYVNMDIFLEMAGSLWYREGIRYKQKT